jgi:hypothetical protein
MCSISAKNENKKISCKCTFKPSFLQRMQKICQFFRELRKKWESGNYWGSLLWHFSKFYSGNEIENSHRRVYCPVGALCTSEINLFLGTFLRLALYEWFFIALAILMWDHFLFGVCIEVGTSVGRFA